MTERYMTQLRLRSAFRYGYYAFLALLCGAALSVLCTSAAVSGAEMIRSLSAYDLVGMTATVGLGLIMPLFLMLWLVAGTAILHLSADKS